MRSHHPNDPEPLDYAPSEVRSLIPWTPLLINSLIVATVFSVLTCLRIEFLNRAVGGILPRTESGKWRVSFAASEPSWRKMRAIISDDAPWNTRPLTAAERLQMTSETTANRANSDLRDFVGSYGLGQYALVPIALVLSTTLFSPRWPPRVRFTAIMCFLSAMCCGYLMIYRDYLGSLGW